MDLIKNMFKIKIRNFNFYTVLSILAIIAGFAIYIFWILRYGVWADIGIYSLTIFLVLTGILGLILSLLDKEEES